MTLKKELQKVLKSFTEHEKAILKKQYGVDLSKPVSAEEAEKILALTNKRMQELTKDQS